MRFFRASRSDMSPLLVETTATPRPPCTGDLIALTVDAQARLGDPLQTGDDTSPLGAVLHLDGQGLARLVTVVGLGERGDVALALEDLGEGHLLLRRRHGDLVVHRHVGVADAGEHVGNRIGHRHCSAPPSPTGLLDARQLAGMRHLTRQIRQRPNLRYTECGRPHRRQRVLTHLELGRLLLLLDECFFAMGHCPSRRNGS